VEGFHSWPKLTGGKGIHLMVPIEVSLNHDQARSYAKSIASRLVEADPARYTLTSAPDARRGKIFIDYLRNGRGNTAIGAYSPRVRNGFPVAAPVSWKQVERGIRGYAFNMSNPPARG
jgi:bifunctional non-homologous end joining protein LigD